jgi:hypothetical protein
MKNLFLLVFIVGLLPNCQAQKASIVEGALNNESATASIVGAWEIVEASVTREDTSFTYSPYRSIIIYTDKFYSVEIAHKERASWPEIPDGEKVSYDHLSNAFWGFTSNSGRYEVRGDSVFYELIVAKNPNVVDRRRGGAYRFTLDGDQLKTYHTWPSRSFSYTYRRLQ